MDWLAANPERRMDPRGLWPGVRSIIMLGVNYGPDENPLAMLEKRSLGAISVYAQGDDYHDVIKKRLKALARWFAADVGRRVESLRRYRRTDGKAFGCQRAGLGWQGKHTNLVSRELGSWFFLGVILTEAELPFDAPEIDHCGSCRACLDVCPTNAFTAERQDRCAALHFLSHHRTQRPDPARIPQGDGQPHLWLRRLPRGARGTSSLRKGAKRNLPRAKI